MEATSSASNSLLREAMLELANMSDEDLAVLIELLRYFKRQNQTAQQKSALAAEIRVEGRKRAEDFRQLPRAEIVARFTALTEKIRAQAIAQGTAVSGDWRGD